MSRRTKRIILALFLVLIAIPSLYVALTWHASEPFRFRYVGQGEVVMHKTHHDRPEAPMVPIFIEVQNTRIHPIYLSYAHLKQEQDKESRHLVALDSWEHPIPGKGTIRLETLVTAEEAQRVEREAFEVGYVWVSETKRKAYGLAYWAVKQVEWQFPYLEPPESSLDSADTTLVKDLPAEPSSPKTSPAP